MVLNRNRNTLGGFAKGERVKISGLQAQAFQNLNGTFGETVEWLPEKSRWAVRCEVNGTMINLKPENMTLATRTASGRRSASASARGAGDSKANKDSILSTDSVSTVDLSDDLRNMEKVTRWLQMQRTSAQGYNEIGSVRYNDFEAKRHPRSKYCQ